jgi:hypothetical protein
MYNEQTLPGGVAGQGYLENLGMGVLVNPTEGEFK